MTEARDLADVPNGIAVDSDGLVTKSSNPAFFVHKNATQTGSSGDVVSFQNVITNIGSHWDDTNHKFIAPVGATYMFCLNWLSNNGSDTQDCSIYKDGTAIMHSRQPNLSGIASVNHNTNNLAIAYYVSASSTIDVRLGAFVNNGSIYGDSNYWTTFSGFLIG